MVEEISWADATVDEAQPVVDSQGNWDDVSKYLGGFRSAGNVAAGMMAWPISKAAAGLVGPFVDGGPDMVEGFVGEFLSLDKAAEDYRKAIKAPIDPKAEAGASIIADPVNKAMETIFTPVEKAKEFT